LNIFDRLISFLFGPSLFGIPEREPLDSYGSCQPYC
jgi:hypothetical protein